MQIRSLLQTLLLLAGLLAAAVSAQQTPEQKPPPDEGMVSVDTTQVVLNVTVTDAKGRYVSGLRDKDFNVFEDKASQKILSFSFEETPFAAVILLDVSGSMEPKMMMARAAVSQFASRIREGDVVAIYSFGGTRVKKLQDFTEVREVDPMVWETNADGMTPLYDGVVKAVDELAKRPERRRAILLVSDGGDSNSKATLDAAMRHALAGQVSIYAIDLSDHGVYRTPQRDSGAEVMKSLATKTGGKFFATPGGGKLREAFEQTVEELRSQYTIVYEPTNEKRDGSWRAIEVRAVQPALIVRTRQGYYSRKVKKH